MKTFTTFIFIGAIIALGVMVGRGAGPATPNQRTEQTSPAASAPENTSASEAPAQGGAAPNGKLFYLSANGTDQEIRTIDVVSKQKQVIYSDSGSDTKIKSVSRITRTGDTILALVGSPEDEAGKLIAIATDGSKKTTSLINNFAVTAPPIVSPDQTKLAVITFSSSDTAFGFTLSLMDITGKNKKDLVTDEAGVSKPVFSPDGKRIAYIKGPATGANQIAVYDLSTNKASTLYEAKGKTIQDFDWSPVGLITFTAGNEKQTSPGSSDIYVLDPRSNEASQLTKTAQVERAAIIAPDASGIAFLQAATDHYSPSRPATIKVTQTDGKNAVELDQATDILGWVK